MAHSAPPVAKLRVLLADDHDIVREGLSALITTYAGWEICGEASNGRQAVAMAAQLKPDVVVLDFAMPDMNGVEAARQIRRSVPEAQVVMLTMHESELLAQRVFVAGVKSLILKTDVRRYLRMAVEAAARGESFLTPRVSEWIMSGRLNLNAKTANKRDGHSLTAREREILQLLAEGKSTKEVAAILGNSVKTAETHRTNLMRKLEVHSVAELVRYAIRNQIIDA